MSWEANEGGSALRCPMVLINEPRRLCGTSLREQAIAVELIYKYIYIYFVIPCKVKSVVQT